jgi:hypothetical protein
MKSKVLQRKMFRDPSEDENVGIMQGFMDSLEEMLTGEGDMSEDDDDSPSGAPDRTPRSPEILMNTMRGDMRSVDARVEELADMVGYNAASSTPLEVLALLQPVLKQQGIAALEAAAPAMPDMGMAPPGMPDMGMAPPPGAMGMAPPPGAMGMAPPPTMEGGIGSLPQGNMGQPPMQMARGGVVQHFQNGSGTEAVTSYETRLNEFLNQKPQTDIDDPMTRARELAPQYQELLGTSDSGATKAQVLFDIAQAALGYASNVGPDGQPLRGSQASRLAGATRALPGQIAARGAQAKEGQARARLAALQQAQSEQAAALAYNTALSADQRAILLAREKQAADMALEREKGRPSFRPATPEEAARFNAVAGQIDEKTDRFYPLNPPAGMSITSTPDGGLQLTQGPGVGSPGARGNLEYTVENGITVAKPIPGTPAAAEVQAQRGKLETMLVTGQETLNTIESIVGRPAVEGGATAQPADPALDSILGMVQGRVWPMTQAGEDLKVKVDQLAGTAFLQAFDILRGGGAISEVEGAKATDAIARLSRTQSPPAFKESLNELADIVRRGVAKTAGDLSALPQPQTPTQDVPPRAVIRYDAQGNRIP